MTETWIDFKDRILLKSFGPYLYSPYTFGVKYASEDAVASILVSIADRDTFCIWEYRDLFHHNPDNGFPLVVVDSNGYWTKCPGTVIEKFGHLLKTPTSMKYVSRESKYISWEPFIQKDQWGM
jgi:hypothetical protein